ncbi:MAG: hypothetical protein WCE93_06735, partial [Nitrososphaeraceae archaeon]
VISCLTHNYTMRNKMSSSSCKREITDDDDDACVTLSVFDSYICTQIFQKLNHIKRNVFVREVIS